LHGQFPVTGAAFFYTRLLSQLPVCCQVCLKDIRVGMLML
jgi:hypothetical protein